MPKFLWLRNHRTICAHITQYMLYQHFVEYLYKWHPIHISLCDGTLNWSLTLRGKPFSSHSTLEGPYPNVIVGCCNFLQLHEAYKWSRSAVSWEDVRQQRPDLPSWPNAVPQGYMPAAVLYQTCIRMPQPPSVTGVECCIEQTQYSLHQSLGWSAVLNRYGTPSISHMHCSAVLSRCSTPNGVPFLVCTVCWVCTTSLELPPSIALHWMSVAHVCTT